MSVVAVAIIAGATAGITKVGSQIVSDLYKALKGKIAEIAHLDLSGIEKQPEDTQARMALEGEVREGLSWIMLPRSLRQLTV